MSNYSIPEHTKSLLEGFGYYPLFGGYHFSKNGLLLEFTSKNDWIKFPGSPASLPVFKIIDMLTGNSIFEWNIGKIVNFKNKYGSEELGYDFDEEKFNGYPTDEILFKNIEFPFFWDLLHRTRQNFLVNIINNPLDDDIERNRVNRFLFEVYECEDVNKIYRQSGTCRHDRIESKTKTGYMVKYKTHFFTDDYVSSILPEDVFKSDDSRAEPWEGGGRNVSESFDGALTNELIKIYNSIEHGKVRRKPIN